MISISIVFLLGINTIVQFIFNVQHFKNTILLSNYLTLQTFSILKKPFCLCAISTNFTSDGRVKMSESRPNSWTVSLCGIKTLFNERRVRIVSRDRNRFDRHQHSQPLVHTKDKRKQSSKNWLRPRGRNSWSWAKTSRTQDKNVNLLHAKFTKYQILFVSSTTTSLNLSSLFLCPMGVESNWRS